MKKLFCVLALAGVFAACNNSTDSTKTEDSTAIKPDTTVVTPPVDTLHVDTSKAKTDTTSPAKK